MSSDRYATFHDEDGSTSEMGGAQHSSGSGSGSSSGGGRLSSAGNAIKQRLSMQAAVYVALVVALVVIFIALILIGTTGSSDGDLEVNVDKISTHLDKLEEIAMQNNGTRLDASPGFFATLDYVQDQLARKAKSYTVTTSDFSYQQWQGTNVSATLAAGNGLVLSTASDDLGVFAYTANAQRGGLRVVTVGDHGCFLSNYPSGLVNGSFVALVQRGNCTFSNKTANAVAAGAAAVVIYDPRSASATDVLVGTASQEDFEAGLQPIAVLGVSIEGAQSLMSMPAAVNLSVTVVGSRSKLVNSTNLLARSPKGNPNNVIVVGAHADSVAAGPGINDNGSGTSTLLSIVQRLHKIGYKPKNQLLFAWWGAEEEGLIGSTQYVRHMSQQTRDNTVAMLDFDMLGSPNWNRGLYNGSSTEWDDARAGSATITTMLEEYYNKSKLVYTLIPFDGRSDYDAFTIAGIPAGGIFAGAEQLKTEAERAEDSIGGLAHAPYDPCYHRSCDTTDNINDEILQENANTILHIINKLAKDKNIRSTLSVVSPSNSKRSDQASRRLSGASLERQLAQLRVRAWSAKRGIPFE